MSNEKLTERLERALINCNREESEKVAKEIARAGLDPIEVIEKVVAPAVRIVGDKFESGEYFLTHLMWAGEAMQSVVRILTADMSEKGRERLKSSKKGTIVIGTVKGDIHDIGKDIVSLVLNVNGFDVHDLGKDVSPMEFITKAEEVNANMIALSSLMTVTMPYQSEVIKLLNELGLRERYKVIIGGGSTRWRIYLSELGC